MAADYLKAATLLLVIGRVMVHPGEILVDDDNPAKKVISLRAENDDDYMQEEIPCHMEYQVMKRVVGTCIKLGRSARGCVAGNYLHPLHPECM